MRPTVVCAIVLAVTPVATASPTLGVVGSGVIGEVDHVAGRPHVSYHTVDLNGKPFKAAWAGNGRIALWVSDGLGVIDTRDWSAHPIAAGITDATPTAYGVIAWNRSGADFALYRPTGALGFRALASRTVTEVETGDNYAYATTTTGRFAIDLRTSRVAGPLASKARLVPLRFAGPLPDQIPRLLRARSAGTPLVRRVSVCPAHP